jgi:RNA polymerase sigma-70 factor (ECF subfamily)
VQGAGADGAPDVARKRAVVAAFLNASRAGDFDGLLALLDPGAVVRADATVVSFGAEAKVRGAAGVAETFSGRAQAARAALIDGAPGAAWMQGGEVRVVFAFTIDGDTVTAIDMVADPDALGDLDVEMLTSA